MKCSARHPAGLLLLVLLNPGCAPGEQPVALLGRGLASYSEQQRLVAGDRSVNANLGSAVAFSDDGSIALCGARFEGAGGAANAGAAYVFVRDPDGTYLERQKLVASDRNTGFVFGHAVALSGSGSIALIASHSQSEPGYWANGAVYVFRRDPDGVFHQQQKLLPGDPQELGRFGYSIALSRSGNTVLIGANGQRNPPPGSRGAVYVWQRDTNGTFYQVHKLWVEDGSYASAFGSTVALSGDGTLGLITNPYASVDGLVSAGEVYVFAKDRAAVWNKVTKLVPDDPRAGATFGSSMALSYDGSTALLASPGEIDSKANVNGAAYRFVRGETGAWTQRQKLVFGDPLSGGFVGNAVALSRDGSVALIGAEAVREGTSEAQGAAYLFAQEAGGQLVESQRITASDREPYARFGFATALSGDGTQGLLGAVYAGGSSPLRAHGAAYVFASADTRARKDNGEACAVARECKSGACISGSCVDWSELSVSDPAIEPPPAKSAPEQPVPKESAAADSALNTQSASAPGCAVTPSRGTGAVAPLMLCLLSLLALRRRRVLPV